MSANADDILAQIDAVTGADAPVAATPPTDLREAAQEDYPELREDGAVTTTDSHEPTEAEIAAASEPMRYDLVVGMIPARLETDDEVFAWLAAERARDAQAEADRAAQVVQAAAAGDADAEQAIRDAIIDDQMASPEAQSGVASWQAELRRAEHSRALKEAALLIAESIRGYMGKYLVFAPHLRDAQLDIMTMWVVHTYCYRAQGVTPYLAVTAPTQGSGKTTVLEILNTLANNPTKIEVNPTAPVVRVLCEDGRTVFLDEIDTLSSDKNFVGTMNSGYKAGGSVSRVGKKSGDTFTETSATFAPKAIAGIARLGTLPLPTATLDRCIEIKIVRAKPGELLYRFRVEVMREDTEVLGMRDWMQRWCDSMRKDLRDAYVDLPRLSSARAEQIWEPLITLAKLLGGDWYQRVCAAAILIDGERKQNVDPNAAMVADIAMVVEAYADMCPDAPQITAANLVSLRNVLAGRKLRDKLTEDSLIARMGAFGVKPEVIQLDDKDTLAYTLLGDDGQLLPVWVDLFERYGE